MGLLDDAFRLLGIEDTPQSIGEEAEAFAVEKVDSIVVLLPPDYHERAKPILLALARECYARGTSDALKLPTNPAK
jgi:hypothetical protein